jgi:YD repeat-containing protein
MKIRLVLPSLLLASTFFTFCGFTAEPVQTVNQTIESEDAQLVIDASNAAAASVEDIEPIVDWQRKQNADQRLEVFGEAVLGDGIDPHTGGLVFTNTDIDLPGNSQLPVTLTRQRMNGFTYRDGANVELGDWTLSVPRIAVTSLSARPWQGARCSQPTAQLFPIYWNGAQSTSGRDYSDGVVLEIPGQASQQLLDSTNNPIFPTQAKKVTRDYWYFTCITASDGGEGFIGLAPNGDRYRFDRAYSVDAPLMGYVGAYPLNRKRYIVAATEVTDVHGNKVNYTYDAQNRLTRIHSNDGREIQLAYNGNLLKSATAGGKTWLYQYRNSTYHFEEWASEYPGTPSGQVLANVVQPDGHAWQLNLDNMAARPAPVGRDNCWKMQYSVSITHPYGLTGTFVLQDTEHRQVFSLQTRRHEYCLTNEPSSSGGGSGSPPPIDENTTTSTMSVVRKTLTGAGLSSPLDWSYRYERDRTPSGTSTADRTNWTEVTAPDAHYTYYHAWVSEPLSGKLVRKETRAQIGGAVLRSESFTYEQEATLGNSYFIVYPGPQDVNKVTNKRQQVISQNGDTFTSDYTYNISHSSASYSYSNPLTSSIKSNVSTVARVTTTSYGHNKTKWILGLPVKEVINGRTTIDRVFDGNGKLTLEKRFGATYATNGYNTDGTLAYAKDANNRQYLAALYKRGVPQKVTRPDNTIIYQYVDDFGRISSIQDANGYVTTYSRDAMGRLLEANPPGSWDGTFHQYNFSGSPTHTITKGDAETTITYDSMFRPVLVKTSDNLTGKSFYNSYQYDTAGREIFSSFPSALSSSNKGVASEYDGLSRLTKKRETVAPFATTTFGYFDSHRRTVTDPEGFQTHYYAYGYDGPDGSDIRSIRSPLGKNTDINKNVWGELTSVRQWGSVNGFTTDDTRTYYYDTTRRLCRVRENDVGDTVYQYDASGWLIAYEKGLSNGSACAVPGGFGKVTLIRDTLGRILQRDFADTSTPDIINTYDDNGNMLSTVRGSTNWSYTYNDINLLNSEQLNVDGRSFNINYVFNTAGALTHKTFPTNDQVQFSPDGLGRPRMAAKGTIYYANNIQYHENGMVKQVNYGNGHAYTQTLNDRQLPLRILTSKGTNKPLDLTYSYDKRQLVTGIEDASPSNHDLTLGYDGLEQITSATGSWGTGEFKYDSLGNVRYKRLGARSVNVNYNAKNLVTSSIDVGNVGGNTGTRNFYHDNRGNVTQSGNISFIYDYADQPISISGAKLGSYTYDGNLKRVKSTIDGKTIYNVYDLSGTLVHIFDVTKNEKTDYVKAGSMTVARVVNNNPIYLHSDALGSPVAGTNSAGTVTFTERYTPFGITLTNHASNDNQAGFTGHIKDSDTGLVTWLNRYDRPS